MKSWRGGLLGVLALAGLTSVLAGEAAWAQRGGVAVRSRPQSATGGIVVRSQRGGTWGTRPPVSRGETPLFAPFNTGALERNFAIMRNTSPAPLHYMGGQLNPRGGSVRFGYRGNDFYLDASYAAYDYGYGYGYGYGGYGYGGYGYPAYTYLPVPPTLYPWGYDFSNFPPLTRERTIIIQREGNGGAPRSQPPPAEPAPRSEPPRRDGEYYLSPREGKANEGLTEALLEIRKAWLNGDFARFRARVPESGKIRIYPNGSYRYSVSVADFGQMTRDAMGRLDTLTFEFDAPRTLDEGRVFVSGKHVFKDADGEKREVNVSYVLERKEGRWYVAEVGSGAERITRHREEGTNAEPVRSQVGAGRAPDGR